MFIMMTVRYTKILILSGEEGEKVGKDFFLKKKSKYYRENIFFIIVKDNKTVHSKVLIIRI